MRFDTDTFFAAPELARKIFPLRKIGMVGQRYRLCVLLVFADLWCEKTIPGKFPRANFGREDSTGIFSYKFKFFL